jgi:hypothetical protein
MLENVLVPRFFLSVTPEQNRFAYERRKMRVLSAAGRAAIVKAAKKRWSKVRKQAKNVANSRGAENTSRSAPYLKCDVSGTSDIALDTAREPFRRGFWGLRSVVRRRWCKCMRCICGVTSNRHRCC